MLMYYFVLRGICLSTFSHDAVRILASPESTARGRTLCKTGELNMFRKLNTNLSILFKHTIYSVDVVILAIAP